MMIRCDCRQQRTETLQTREMMMRVGMLENKRVKLKYACIKIIEQSKLIMIKVTKLFLIKITKNLFDRLDNPLVFKRKL